MGPEEENYDASISSYQSSTPTGYQIRKARARVDSLPWEKGVFINTTAKTAELRNKRDGQNGK